MQVDLIILDAFPESLYEDIITPASSPVHADSNPFFLQKRCILHAGELAALVSIEDVRFPTYPECFLNRLNTEICAQGV